MSGGPLRPGGPRTFPDEFTRPGSLSGRVTEETIRYPVVGGDPVTSPDDLFYTRTDSPEMDLGAVAFGMRRSPASSIGAPKSFASPEDPIPQAPSTEHVRKSVEDEYIAAQLALRGLRPERWTSSGLFRAGGLEAKFTFLKALDVPVPGGPEVATFLHPTVFRAPLRQFEKALGHRPSHIRQLSADAYFASSPKKIQVIVGHVEGRDFVMRGVRGEVIERLPILDLMQKEESNGILLIPVGCRTADTQAPLGSTRNITTDEISAMMGRLSERQGTLGDIVWAMEPLGTIEVKFDRLGRAVELIVADNGLAKVQVYLPRPFTPAPGQNMGWSQELAAYRSSQEVFTAERLAARYPGLWGRIRLYSIDHPVWWWLGRSGVLFGLFLVSAIAAESAVVRTRSEKGVLLNILYYASLTFAVAFLISFVGPILAFGEGMVLKGIAMSAFLMLILSPMLLLDYFVKTRTNRRLNKND